MVHLWRSFAVFVSLALLAVGCMSSTSVNSTDAAPTSTPIPTSKPIFIPTIPPQLTPLEISPTAVVASDDADSHPAASDDESTEEDDSAGQGSAANADDGDGDADEGSGDAVDDPEPTTEPTAAPTPFPTPTADIRPPATPRPPRPAPRPVVPTAVPTVVNRCPNGMVLVGSGCACPSGTTERPSDGQCIRFCRQSELTISNQCVCTGTFYDTGGQCVKRCQAGEVPDGAGGCKIPNQTAIN